MRYLIILVLCVLAHSCSERAVEAAALASVHTHPGAPNSEEPESDIRIKRVEKSQLQINLPSGLPRPERPRAGTEPRLAVDANEKEAAAVYQGETIDILYSLRNDGPGTLVIADKHIPCACTTAQLEIRDTTYTLGDAIRPGETALLRLSINTAGILGIRNFTFQLATNDPSLPGNSDLEFGVCILKLTINVKKFIVFDDGAESLALPSLPNYQDWNKSVVLRSTDQTPYSIVRIDGCDSVFDAAFAPIDELKTAWKVDINIKPNKKIGSFAKRFEIVSDRNLPPTFLYICGSFRGKILVEPANGLYFSEMVKGKVTTKSVSLSTDDGSDLQIEKIQIVRQSIPRGKFEPVDENHNNLLQLVEDSGAASSTGKITINASIKSGAPPGPFFYGIRVTSKREDGPRELEIPISGIVR
ncbi:MAG: hypothetical protein ACKVS6_17020 [Planctomycetota bacterium]